MGRSRCRCIRANLSSRIKVRRKWNRKPLSSRSVCARALLIEWATACTGERLQLKFAFDVHASESQTSHALAYTSSLSINLPTLPLYLSTDSNGTNQPSPTFFTSTFVRTYLTCASFHPLCLTLRPPPTNSLAGNFLSYSPTFSNQQSLILATTERSASSA